MTSTLDPDVLTDPNAWTTEETTPSTPEAVAHHEAGHAIAYLAWGLPIRYVTLRPRGIPGALGFVSPGRPGRVIDRQTDAWITLAGPVAELYYMTRAEDAELDGDDFDPWGDYDGRFGTHYLFRRNTEYPEIQDAARTWPFIPVETLGEHLIDVVHHLWEPISRLAGALLASPRAVTGTEVYRLIGATSPRTAETMLCDLLDTPR